MDGCLARRDLLTSEEEVSIRKTYAFGAKVTAAKFLPPAGNGCDWARIHSLGAIDIRFRKLQRPLSFHEKSDSTDRLWDEKMAT